MSTTRKFALVILAAALLAGAGLLYWNSRTTPAFLAKTALPRYHQITQDDLIEVNVSANRASEFQVVASKATLVGMYTAQETAAGALFTPNMIVSAPPVLRVFTSGKELPAGLRGYPLTLSTDLAPILREDDLVDIVIINPGSGTATWIFSNVQPLSIMQSDQDRQAATYLLAMTPEQIAVLEGRLADARVDQTGSYAKLVLSQSKNPALDPLTEFEYRDLKLPAGAGAPAGTSTPVGSGLVVP